MTSAQPTNSRPAVTQAAVSGGIREAFNRLCRSASETLGSPRAFILAILSIIAWAATGGIFHYSDTWQLVVNTGTSIATFLMVFLIQNTQNRDARALHLKLDELIRASEGARNHLVDLEKMTDEELGRLAEEFASLNQRALAKHNAS